MSALPNLRGLNLSGIGFCLPGGVGLSHGYSSVDAHLKSLNLPACSAAVLAASAAAPRKLAASSGGGRVALAWGAAADASGYGVWVWDSIGRRLGPVGGLLTGTSYIHAVLRKGRNCFFQVRTRAHMAGPVSNQDLQKKQFTESWPLPLCSNFSPYQDSRNCGSDNPHNNLG